MCHQRHYKKKAKGTFFKRFSWDHWRRLDISMCYKKQLLRAWCFLHPRFNWTYAMSLPEFVSVFVCFNVKYGLQIPRMCLLMFWEKKEGWKTPVWVETTRQYFGLSLAIWGQTCRSFSLCVPHAKKISVQQ